MPLDDEDLLTSYDKSWIRVVASGKWTRQGECSIGHHARRFPKGWRCADGYGGPIYECEKLIQWSPLYGDPLLLYTKKA